MTPNILVIGACGQIGTELTIALRKRYESTNVIAADLKSESDLLKGTGPFLQFDIMDKDMLGMLVRKHKINHIYLLAAILSASGEQQPRRAWDLNMQSLLNTLEVAREENVSKVFWPSSIAVFGSDAPKENCPQDVALWPGTVYGISKAAGEAWCKYYYDRYGVDTRSLRYPGLISHHSLPGGGTTDYAVDIFHAAVDSKPFTCFLKPHTRLPMMYMEDAVRATIELMEAPARKISVRTSYNLAAISFTPAGITREIKKHYPTLETSYAPDYRQAIADSWPASIDDSRALRDWGWKPRFGLAELTTDMLLQLSKKDNLLLPLR
jgi:nucleoside-diphosphate-sugar epimerase